MPENTVVAFLNHLKENRGARERVEYELLRELVQFAKSEGYDFKAEDFKHTVSVHIFYDIADLLRWPTTR